MTGQPEKISVVPDDRRAEKGLSAQCRKLLLTLNIGLVLLGLAIFSLGFVPKFGQGLIGPKLRSYAQGILGDARDSGLEEIDLSSFDIGDVLDGVATVMMSTGLGLVLVSSVGFFGSKKYVVWCLIPYCVCMGGILFAEGIVFFFYCNNRAVLDRLVTPGLLADLQARYTGYNGTDTVSQTWTLVMIGLSCCGVNNHTDFEAATNWRRRYFQDGWFFELTTPLPCCVFETKAPDDYSCAVNPRPATSNYHKGCYATLLGWMETYQIVIILALTGLLLTQVGSLGSGVLLTRYLIRKRRSQNNDENDDDDDDQTTSRGVKNLRRKSRDDDDHPSIIRYPKRSRNPGLADGLGLNMASMLLPPLLSRQNIRPGGDPFTDGYMYDYRSYMAQLLASSFGQPPPQQYFPQRDQAHAPMHHDLLPPVTSLVRRGSPQPYLVPNGPRSPPIRMIQSQPSSVAVYSNPPAYENAGPYMLPSRIMSADDATADRHVLARQRTRRRARRKSQRHVESSSSSSASESEDEVVVQAPKPHKQQSVERQDSGESSMSSTSSSSIDSNVQT